MIIRNPDLCNELNIHHSGLLMVFTNSQATDNHYWLTKCTLALTNIQHHYNMKCFLNFAHNKSLKCPAMLVHFVFNYSFYWIALRVNHDICCQIYGAVIATLCGQLLQIYKTTACLHWVKWIIFHIWLVTRNRGYQVQAPGLGATNAILG